MTELPSFTSPPHRDGSRTRRYIGAAIILLIIALIATQTLLNRTSVGNARFVQMSMILWTATVVVILALLILGTVLGRNLIKLYFERKSGQVGSRFKAKMVRIFVALSLLPAVLLFSLAYTLVKGSIEQWFSAPAVELHKWSLAIAEQYYREAGARALSLAENIAAKAGARERLDNPLQPDLEQALSEMRQLYHIENLRIYTRNGVLAGESGSRLSGAAGVDVLVAAALEGVPQSQLKAIAPGEVLRQMIWAAAPIRNRKGEVFGAIVTETEIPNSVRFQEISVMEAYDAYQRLQSRESALRFN